MTLFSSSLCSPASLWPFRAFSCRRARPATWPCSRSPWPPHPSFLTVYKPLHGRHRLLFSFSPPSIELHLVVKFAAIKSSPSNCSRPLPRNYFAHLPNPLACYLSTEIGLTLLSSSRPLATAPWPGRSGEPITLPFVVMCSSWHHGRDRLILLTATNLLTLDRIRASELCAAVPPTPLSCSPPTTIPSTGCTYRRAGKWRSRRSKLRGRRSHHRWAPAGQVRRPAMCHWRAGSGWPGTHERSWWLEEGWIAF
jgi:hypothetical protein